jgi:hypothetical protein
MKPAETYILKQNEPYKSMLLHLQVLIEHVIPEADLLFKWRLPFYYIGKRPICYLNQSKNYVDVGFYHGKYMSKHRELMVSENRKLVRSLRYFTLEEIDDRVLLDVVTEAKRHMDKPLMG